jgi:hypothetical protein
VGCEQEGTVKLPRRQFLHLAAGAAALSAVSRIARAQAYPSRPVRIVAGFAAGGGADITGRLIGQWLSERFGQQFVIENRPGEVGNLATETVVNAPPDGYTLLIVNAANAINATLYNKLSFNFIRDIAPVASITRESLVMALNPLVPAKTVPELIAYAKANPGKLSMGSGGNGSTSHVVGELFKLMTGVNMVHVPYRSIGLAFADLIGTPNSSPMLQVRLSQRVRVRSGLGCSGHSINAVEKTVAGCLAPFRPSETRRGSAGPNPSNRPAPLRRWAWCLRAQRPVSNLPARI